MIIHLLERIRRLFKSIGKKEEKVVDHIIYLKSKKNQNNFRLIDQNFNPSESIKEPIKLAAIIGFFFREDKLQTLFKVCQSLGEISDYNEIYILTNQISPTQEKKIREGLKNNIQIKIIDDILHDRLLPWYHLNLMRKLYDKKELTHFAYLEDDILINKSNFNYWLNSRKILKKFNLIPGFIRTEINNDDNELYAIDFTKENKIKLLPKIIIDNRYYFVNHKFPYQGMYIYDRDLMNEHLFGPSSNPDCGHGAFDTNYINTKMINLDLMAKANIGLTYINVPDGMFNRMVTLYDREKKEIYESCLIKHLTNKYSNLESMFGNIKLKNALK